MTKSTELEALMKFLKEAQQDLAKKDIEGAQISIKHALGRAKISKAYSMKISTYWVVKNHEWAWLSYS